VVSFGKILISKASWTRLNRVSSGCFFRYSSRCGAKLSGTSNVSFIVSACLVEISLGWIYFNCRRKFGLMTITRWRVNQASHGFGGEIQPARVYDLEL
jgi:hypothetical protein